MGHRAQASALTGALAIVVLVAACGSLPGGTVPIPPIESGRPTPPASGASPSPASSPKSAADTSSFDARFAEAVDASLAVPLAGLPADAHASPTCQAMGESGSPARSCMASIPAADPLVTLWVTSAGSMGATRGLMVYVAMPYGIAGTALKAPALGDEARLSRGWGERGCSAVLAVRDGTLIVSVQVRLTAGAATADCGRDVPADYLEKVARTLLDNMAAFRTIGLPVDDAVARDRVVRLITGGTLKASKRDLVTLPPEFANLSDGGEAIAMRDGKDWTIVFFEVRGVVDVYSGWVFRSSGKLAADEDPLGGGSATVERIDDHWFHVVSA